MRTKRGLHTFLRCAEACLSFLCCWRIFVCCCLIIFRWFLYFWHQVIEHNIETVRRDHTATISKLVGHRRRALNLGHRLLQVSSWWSVAICFWWRFPSFVGTKRSECLSRLDGLKIFCVLSVRSVNCTSWIFFLRFISLWPWWTSSGVVVSQGQGLG